jgi:hypothetical protein
VDTGANIVVISKALADTLNLQLERYDSVLRLAHGQVGVRWKAGGLSVAFSARHPLFELLVRSVQVYVQPGSDYDVILGMSVLGHADGKLCPIGLCLLYTPFPSAPAGSQLRNLQWYVPVCARTEHYPGQVLAPAAAAAGAAELPDGDARSAELPVAGVPVRCPVLVDAEALYVCHLGGPAEPQALPPWPGYELADHPDVREQADQFVRGMLERFPREAAGPALADAVRRMLAPPAVGAAEPPGREAIWRDLRSPPLQGQAWRKHDPEPQLAERLMLQLSSVLNTAQSRRWLRSCTAEFLLKVIEKEEDADQPLVGRDLLQLLVHEVMGASTCFDDILGLPDGLGVPGAQTLFLGPILHRAALDTVDQLYAGLGWMSHAGDKLLSSVVYEVLDAELNPRQPAPSSLTPSKLSSRPLASS